MLGKICVKVNGKHYEVMCDEASVFLDVLRGELGLTGTKKSCKEGTAGSTPYWWTAARSIPVSYTVFVDKLCISGH